MTGIYLEQSRKKRKRYKDRQREKGAVGGRRFYLMTISTAETTRHQWRSNNYEAQGGIEQ
jgi:hypothetical protein